MSRIIEALGSKAFAGSTPQKGHNRTVTNNPYNHENESNHHFTHFVVHRTPDAHSQRSKTSDKNHCSERGKLQHDPRRGGGTFMMGSTDEQESGAEEDEFPAHSVTLRNYYIGETEVTKLYGLP